MENCGPGYGTDINVPVYATVKGVSSSLANSSSLITINDHGILVFTVKGVGTSLPGFLLPGDFGQPLQKAKMRSFHHYHDHS